MKTQFLLSLVIVFVFSCHAATFTVDKDGAGDFFTIQSAIAASTNGDVIIVNPGIYFEDVDFLKKDITLQSTEPTNASIIEATQITPPGGSITGSDGTFEGFRLNGCFIFGNNITGEPSYSPTIRHCHIIAEEIGISYYVGYQQPTNYPLIENNIIEASTGLYVSTQAYALGSEPTIRHNTFIGIGSDVGGAGVLCRSHSEVCKIYNNIFIKFQWGILFTYDSIFDERIPWIQNNNFWDNLINYYAGNAPFDLTGVQGNISADPLFVDDENGDYHLQFNSPCIDTGKDAGTYIDYDGNIRPLDGNNDGVAGFDMGPYETVPVTDAPVIIFNPANLVFVGKQGQTFPLQQTFSIRNGGAGTLDWQIIEDCPWLEISISSGDSTGEFDEIEVTADATGLERGTYYYDLPVYADNAVNSPEYLPVTFIVKGTIRVPQDYGTIQEAIDAASEGDRIVLANGTYTGTGNKDLDFHGKQLTVQSQNGPSNCIIDCQSSGRAFFFHSAETLESEIQGITLINGNGSGLGGGAILCDGGTVGISDCIFINNFALFGGAIYCPTGMKASNCTFSKNRSMSDGGAIRGIDITVLNSVFTGNESNGSGGAITTIGGVNKIFNCNIIGNKAPRYDDMGGGLVVAGNYRNETYLQNCIVRNNISYRGSQISVFSWSYGTSTLYVSYNNIEGSAENIENIKSIVRWQDGNINENPMFQSSGYWSNETWHDGDYHLRKGSKCINAGNPEGDYEGQTDFDGQARLINGRVDIGADEYLTINKAPIADAGLDIIAYAGIDGLAQVTLDGTNSYDEDGDTLAYFWYNDANELIATGTEPSVLLGVGEQEITLIVNDGTEDSGPDACRVTVIEALEGQARILPKSLNRKRQGQHVIGWLTLPDEIDRSDLDLSQPLLLIAGDTQIEAVRQSVLGGKSQGRHANPVSILAFFETQALLDAVEENGNIELTLTTYLNTGQVVYGTDHVQFFKLDTKTNKVKKTTQKAASIERPQKK